MKKVAYTCFLLSILYCCGTPKNFSYLYTAEDTGLDKRIDLNGYYQSEHGCDSSFYSLYMFYPDGLFTIATASHVSQELTDCFVRGGDTPICKYPIWGVYELHGDTIKTQALRRDGSGFVIFRDYLILPDKKIVNISDYVEPEYSNLGYLKNYPSFYENRCAKPARFYPLSSKRNVSDCPFMNKGWFKQK